MKVETGIIFISGYIIFCVLLQLFGIGELIKGRIKEFKDSNNELISSKSTEHTKIAPDDLSTPLTLSKEELGRITWSLFHSVGAAFPLEPTKEYITALENFMNSMRFLYPCKLCREHFKEVLDTTPITVKDRKSAVRYFCELHNKVNKRLNKAEFDCTKAKEYWGGDCGCDIEDNT